MAYLFRLTLTLDEVMSVKAANPAEAKQILEDYFEGELAAEVEKNLAPNTVDWKTLDRLQKFSMMGEPDRIEHVGEDN